MDWIKILYTFFLLQIHTTQAFFKCGCPPGPRGLKGETGDTGAQGPQGDTGSPGMQGPAGAPGMDGTAGTPGAQGIQGPAGAPGADGTSGAVGAPGPAGAPGVRGPRGFRGQNGIPGTPGAAGAAGSSGAPGPQGIQGIRGLQGVQGQKGEPGVCTCVRSEIAASISQMSRPQDYDPYYEFSAPHQFDLEATSDIFGNHETVEINTENFDYVEGSGNQLDYAVIQPETDDIENIAENEIEDNNQQNIKLGQPNRKNNRVFGYAFPGTYHKLRAGIPILVPPTGKYFVKLDTTENSRILKGVPSTQKPTTGKAQFYPDGPSVQITTFKNLKKRLTGSLEAAIIEIQRDIYELRKLYRDLSGNRL